MAISLTSVNGVSGSDWATRSTEYVAEANTRSKRGSAVPRWSPQPTTSIPTMAIAHVRFDKQLERCIRSRVDASVDAMVMDHPRQSANYRRHFQPLWSAEGLSP